jgi:uncharacterized protein (DUF1684 family)
MDASELADFELADYRAAVARLYLSDTDLGGFRDGRDELFGTHPQSPVPKDFASLRYYPPNPDAVVAAALRPEPGDLAIDTGGEDGVVRYRRIGILDTPYGELSLWWLDAYAGGLFLPVRDGTSGDTTYGGGRYLTDSVKGTHGRGVELVDGVVRLDFNYLYNPSCAYDDRWACPLAPPENTVTARIEAGELLFRS